MKKISGKREITIYLFVNLILAILNYQTNQFEFVWFIYPLIIWGGIIIINRYIK
jgi:hypothetical protein